MTGRLSLLLDWLRAIDTVTGVRPVRAAIGRGIYDGAVYIDTRHANGQRYYLLGVLPPSYVRSTRTCYRVNGALDDWYVATYAPHPIAGTEAADYPHGAWFMLCRWQVPGGEAIDWGAARPYTRVDARIEEVR